MQKLARFSEEMENLKNKFYKCKQSEGDTRSNKEELDAKITNEVDKIKKNLNNTLNDMITDLKNHQTTQQAEALKINQEISTLKKEKLDLYQKINDLQKRISDMEMTIGQDIPAFA